MKRHFRWDKKYLYWGVTAFCVIAAAILFYMALRFLPAVGNAVKKLIGILSPFVWGLIITYLLHPMASRLEKNWFMPLGSRLYKGKKKKNRSKRFARVLSVIVSELVLLAILTALVYLILPQLFSSIETIVQNSPTYAENLRVWADDMLKNFPEVMDFINQRLDAISSNFWDWMRTNVLPLISSVSSGVIVAVRGVYNLVIGIIVSVYILSNYENFNANARRVLYSVFSLEAADKIREGLAFTDKTFMGFINGKLLDSAIIGLICYIVCSILNMPYALLVSVIVGITNIIPFFGPFIGAVPGTIIILMISPFKALIFVIFIIILQQVDGNLIGPKILGSSVGINGFWVMFSIILGAGLFGFWGMLLGVPVFVLIYTAISGLVERKLKRSDLPWETAEYVNLDHIDPVTRQAVKKPGDDLDQL